MTDNRSRRSTSSRPGSGRPGSFRAGGRPPAQPPQRRSRRPQAELPETYIDNLRIERIVGDGLGLGFEEDGLAVFVPLTAPGDLIRAKVTRRQGKVFHAKIDKLIEASTLRIEPRVPDYDASGGLDLMHIGYQDQLSIKAGIITDSLRRIARLTPPPTVEVVPSENEWHYRSRAEFQIDQKAGAVGYFAVGSHRVVDVEESPVLTLDTQALLTTLRDDFEAGLVPKTAREYRAVTGDTGSVLEQTNSPRSRQVMREVGGELYRYSAECFFQANIPVTNDLVTEVTRIADEATTDDGIALDLYCGVGMFSIPLARRFRRVVGVESFGPAVTYAEENLAGAGLRNGRFVTAPVEHWLAGDRSPLGRVALAVFDPPRSGAGKATIEHLARLNPAHIAAVSCDPATFSRDIHDLTTLGYEVMSVRGFDMFPQTHHVEIVAHLQRRAV